MTNKWESKNTEQVKPPIYSTVKRSNTGRRDYKTENVEDFSKNVLKW